MLHIIPENQDLYFVMEYVCHGTLADYSIDTKNMKESTVVYIMKQLFQGINYLHSKGICHRDLKPDNILVEDYNINGDPYVKITDFGYATIFGDDKETMDGSTRLGTAAYMAPELIKSDPHSEKVDIWALGVIAYNLLTKNKFPFEIGEGETFLQQ